MPEERVEQQPPKVLALILADTVLRDIASEKYVIEGTFSVVVASSFPWRQPVIAIYAAITNGHGRTAMKLRLIDIDEARDPIMETETFIDFADPIIVAEMVVALKDVEFLEPGEYCVQLYGAGAPLASDPDSNGRLTSR